MGRQEFGELVKRKRLERKWSLGRLGLRIGELADGTILDAAGVRNLEEGKRAIEKDPELFERAIVVLDLDPDEAYVSLGLLPPGVALDDIRKLRGKQQGGNRRRTDRPVKAPRLRPRTVETRDCTSMVQAA